MVPRPFVPDEFEAPHLLETDLFRLRMLSISDVGKDFEAVMANKVHLHNVWGNTWPEGLTPEQNLIDLGWHQKEFQRRTSFTYTVVTPDESMVLGCVYIYPPSKTEYDAEIYLWARQDMPGDNLESQLETAVRKWIAETWPFTRPVYPGKDMPLSQWKNSDDSS